MAMTERVIRLRKESLDAIPRISSERAELITDFYQKQDRCYLLFPKNAVWLFAYLMEHKTIYIGDGKLIVGEKGLTQGYTYLPRALLPLP